MKIDLGCGKNKKEGFIGVDQFPMDGVDVVLDIGSEVWPWEDNSVEEAHCSHFLEHLTNFEGKWERTHFFNELFRVMAPGAKCSLIIPHWSSTRYYGDPTHKEPFSEMGFYYLSKEWRMANAPHADKEVNPYGYDCNFIAVWGNGMHPTIVQRSPDFQQFAMAWFKEAIHDIHATLTKPEK
jgi:hypothetical protein